MWAVAASRDTGLHVNTAALSGYHSIDPDIDRERDQVMADLLASGGVSSWQVASGQLAPGDVAHVREKYRTDGDVYVVDLTRAGRQPAD